MRHIIAIKSVGHSLGKTVAHYLGKYVGHSLGKLWHSLGQVCVTLFGASLSDRLWGKHVGHSLGQICRTFFGVSLWDILLGKSVGHSLGQVCRILFGVSLPRRWPDFGVPVLLLNLKMILGTDFVLEFFRRVISPTESFDRLIQSGLKSLDFRPQQHIGLLGAQTPFRNLGVFYKLQFSAKCDIQQNVIFGKVSFSAKYHFQKNVIFGNVWFYKTSFRQSVGCTKHYWASSSARTL